VTLAILQNLWRPVLVSRIAHLADPSRTATLLSIESQAKSLFVAAAAPLLGWAVDAVAAARADWRFLPVAVAGSGVCLLMLATARRGG
jgi:hypothetical protein